MTDEYPIGSWVALGCPECDWVSNESKVLDQVNGTWHAFQAISGEFRWHLAEHHPRVPVRMSVRAPEGDRALKRMAGIHVDRAVQRQGDDRD